jgi:hypothetical protein
MIVWYQNSKPFEVATGTYSAGRENGSFYAMSRNGDVLVTYFEHGRKIVVNNRLEPVGDAKPLLNSPNARWITSREGIRLWNPNPQPNESCSWTGTKDEKGYADGPGLVIWYMNSAIAQVSSGTYVAGRADGVEVITLPDGNNWVTYSENGIKIQVAVKLDRADQVASSQTVRRQNYNAPSTTRESDDTITGSRGGDVILGLGAVYLGWLAKEKAEQRQAVTQNRSNIKNNGYQPGAGVKSSNGGFYNISGQGWEGFVVEKVNDRVYRVKIHRAHPNSTYIDGRTYEFLDSEIQPY